MINQILKYWWILLLIGGLVVAGLWIWRRWLGPQLQLEETVISIKKINEIGELITAEFYGEAINSYGEAAEDAKREQERNKILVEIAEKEKVDQVPVGQIPIATIDTSQLFKPDTLSIGEKKVIVESWQDAILGLYEEVREALIEVDEESEKKLNAKKRMAAFRANYGELVQQSEYGDLIDVIGKAEKNALKTIFNTTVDKFEKDRPFAKYRIRQAKAHAAGTRGGKNKGKKEKELVFIGRGWVKAGFDLANFSFDDCCDRYGDSALVVKNLQPEILDADINPWFIPERKIPGFEVLYSKKEKRFEFPEVQLVKKGCKKKLILDALDRGILETAVESGEETMLGMLNLLGFPDLEDVIIRTDSFITERTIVFYDDDIVEFEELDVVKARLERRGVDKLPHGQKFLKELVEKQASQIEKGLVNLRKVGK